MNTDWILRVGDGGNLIRSSKHRIWGIQAKTTNSKYFVKNVKCGDRLWFVKSNSNGKLLAVATYRSHNMRVFGPLLNTMTNEELGWTGDDTNWASEYEIHYSDLYNLTSCNMLTHIKGAATIRKYNENCKVNLAVEYSSITKYSRVTCEL